MIKEITSQYVIFIIFPLFVYSVVHYYKGYYLEEVEEAKSVVLQDSSYDFWVVTIVYNLLLLPVYYLVFMITALLTFLFVLTLYICCEKQ